MEDKFKQLVVSAQRIFITSHISPDPDAAASTVLLEQAVKLNFPNIACTAVLEDEPKDLRFITGYAHLKFDNVLSQLKQFKPDLFILLDGNNFNRCSRRDGDSIRQYIKQSQLKTLIIDHHEPAGKDEADLYINNGQAATVQEIYQLLQRLDLKLPAGSAETAMTGFYADTGGFVYVKTGSQNSLFGFAEKLVSAGADIEAIKNQLESYSEDDMKVLSQLSGNLSHKHDYSYSFLSDEFMQCWAESGRDHLSLQRPTNNFLNSYIRNIDGRRWGFIVYKNLAQDESIYSASFRSQGGVPDVAAIANRLGGGGHKPAAGSKFPAKDLKEALNKVEQAINQTS